MMVAGMNGGSHAAIASWGLDLANVPADGEILDIGCGGVSSLLGASSSSSTRTTAFPAITKKWEKMIEGMHTYTPDELKTHLTAAGFRDVVVQLKESKHWLCVTAIK